MTALASSVMLEPLVEPTFAEAIIAAIDARLTEAHVSFPGRVEAFDPATQRADVQPLVKKEYPNEDGSRGTLMMPVLTDVPVRFDGSGDYGATYPVAPGDTVLLVFCSCSIDQWLSNGGIVDPLSDRHHHISDAVAFAGFRDNRSAIANFANDAYVIRTPTEIRLGSSDASGAVVVQSALDSFIMALDIAIVTLTTGGVASAALAPALSALKTALTMEAPGGIGGWSAGTTKTKAE